MAWDDPIKDALDEVANHLKCKVTQTDNGCVFHFGGKNYYFNYFINSNKTFRVIYNPSFKNGGASLNKPVEIGNYRISELERLKKEIIAKILNMNN